MLKSILLFIALTGAAQAAEPAYDFHALDQMFQVASRPDVVAMRGWMAGRCFLPGDLDKARASLLAVESVSGGDMMIALLGDENDPAAFEVLRMCKCRSARQGRDMLLDPGALLLAFCRVVPPGFAFDVISHQLGKVRARTRQPFGKLVDFLIDSITNNQPLIGVKHGQSTHHVIERKLKAAIELHELFRVSRFRKAQ